MLERSELAAELGFWPATTEPVDIERHRAQITEQIEWETKAAAVSLTTEQLQRRYSHLHIQADRSARKQQ